MASDMMMVVSHDPRFVALSILVSVFAAYVAGDLVLRVMEARRWARLTWLAGAATVDGIGTWSSHYTGMLALRSPIPLVCDWPVVLLALLVGISGSAGALLILSRGRPGWRQALAAGVLFGGIGVSGLHYTAVAAVRQPGSRSYSPAIAILSIVLAIAIASAAFGLPSVFREYNGRSWRSHGITLLRGSANPVMHYTAMAGAILVFSSQPADLSHAINIASLGIVGIGIIPAVLLTAGLLTSTLDRLQKQRALLDQLFEQAPEAVALMNVENRVVRINRGFTRVFGYSPKEAIGRRIDELIIPAERSNEYESNAQTVAQGQRVDAETVRHHKDGTLLQVSLIGVPVSIPGGQIAVYALYRDVTARKEADERLRTTTEQLRALSLSLQSAREQEGTRIAHEIHDELGSALTSLKWDLEALGKAVGETGRAPEKRPIEEKIQAMVRLVDSTVNTVRRISSELRPVLLDDLGLLEAIEWQADQFQRRTGIVCHHDFSLETVPVSREQATALFRILQEALTNVMRHSQASLVEIVVRQQSGELVLSISDNGIGIPAGEAAGHRSIGILGMRERAHAIGAAIEISGVEGEGTTVVVRLPMPEPEST